MNNKNIKSIIGIMLLILLLSAGCGKEKEAVTPTPTPTETLDDNNTITEVKHDSEGIAFTIAVVEGDMKTDFENLIKDCEEDHAANNYKITLCADVSVFKDAFAAGGIDIATMSLEDAYGLYQEKPGSLCVLNIISEQTDEETGETSAVNVTVATTDCVRTYKGAMQLFVEELRFSAGDNTYITGNDMRLVVEDVLTRNEQELPEDDFYYPLPEVLPPDESLESEDNMDVENADTTNETNGNSNNPADTTENELQ